MGSVAAHPVWQMRRYFENAKSLGAPRAVRADFRLPRKNFGSLFKLSPQFDDICLHASRGVSETSTRGTGLLAVADQTGLRGGRCPFHLIRSRLFKVRGSTRELQADNRRLPPELAC